MKVLVACEESQTVCKAFRELWHEAYSCDIQDCSGGHPEWHVMGDCLPLLNGGCSFTTTDGISHDVQGEWDLIIAHPPCTYLTVTGNRWFNVERYGDAAIKRAADREEAAQFFMEFTKTNCKHVAIENPIGVMSTRYRKPDQTIQPYQFGEPHRKGTCLWLIGLPTLKPTKIVEPEIYVYKNGKGTDSPWHVNSMKLPPPERARVRSKTFEGIAKAMAEQWSEYLKDNP